MREICWIDICLHLDILTQQPTLCCYIVVLSYKILGREDRSNRQQIRWRWARELLRLYPMLRFLVLLPSLFELKINTMLIHCSTVEVLSSLLHYSAVFTYTYKWFLQQTTTLLLCHRPLEIKEAFDNWDGLLNKYFTTRMYY